MQLLAVSVVLCARYNDRELILLAINKLSTNHIAVFRYSPPSVFLVAFLRKVAIYYRTTLYLTQTLKQKKTIFVIYNMRIIILLAQ